MLFIEYPKCTTCKKAKKYLENYNVIFQSRNIITEPPTVKELASWLTIYDIKINKLFNTSGLKYRELKLKEKLKEMPISSQLELLASDGMLIKRPLLITKNKILIGFKEKEWSEFLKEEI